MSTNLGIISVISLIPYTSVSWDQRQHPSFLLRCHLFQVQRATLLNDIKEIDERIKSDNTSILDQILLYANENYNHDTNKKILLSIIKFCIDSRRLTMPLLQIIFYVK